MKMPQLNRKSLSAAAKRRKKEEYIKLMKNVKVFWTDLLLSQVVHVTYRGECSFKHQSC